MKTSNFMEAPQTALTAELYIQKLICIFIISTGCWFTSFWRAAKECSASMIHVFCFSHHCFYINHVCLPSFSFPWPECMLAHNASHALPSPHLSFRLDCLVRVLSWGWPLEQLLLKVHSLSSAYLKHSPSHSVKIWSSFKDTKEKGASPILSRQCLLCESPNLTLSQLLHLNLSTSLGEAFWFAWRDGKQPVIYCWMSLLVFHRHMLETTLTSLISCTWRG